jgi:2-methylfumaryl-CoA isomerase
MIFNGAPLLPMRDGFTRDFATVGGQRVVVAPLTCAQFADLAQAAGLADTFAFLERLLDADFSNLGDLCANRGVITTLLAPWFSRQTVADLASAFAGTSVSWAPLQDLADRPGSRT